MIDATVIVPVYRRPRELDACLWSLGRQTFDGRRWEVIVVDDGSPDDTAAVAEAHQERMPLRVIRQAPRSGSGAARNRALAAANGTTIIFVDSDALAPPWFVGAHVASHRGAQAFVDGPAITWRGSDVPSPPPFDRRGFKLAAALSLWGAPFVTVNVSCPRDALLRAGGFDETFGTRYGWEDSELGVRLRARGIQRRRSRRAWVLHWQPESDAWRVRGRKQEDAGWNAVYFLARHPSSRVRRQVLRRRRLARCAAAAGGELAWLRERCERAAQRGAPSEWMIQLYEAASFAAGYDRAVLRVTPADARELPPP